MVNPRIWTFFWIIIVVFLLALGQFVDSKKHRASHSHRHSHQHHQKQHPKTQHHHHHHHRRHNPLVKNFSRPINMKSKFLHDPLYTTKFFGGGNSFLNETSISSSPSIIFSNEEIIGSSEFTTMWNTTTRDTFDSNNLTSKLGQILENSNKEEIKASEYTAVWNTTIRSTFDSNNLTSKLGQILENSSKEEIKASEYTTMWNTTIRSTFDSNNLTSKPGQILENSSKEETKASEYTTMWSTTVDENFDNHTSLTRQNFCTSKASSTSEKLKEPSTSRPTSVRLSTTESIADVRETTAIFLSTGNEILNTRLNNDTSVHNPNGTLNITNGFDVIQKDTILGIRESREVSTRVVDELTNTSRLQHPDNNESVTDRLASSNWANTTDVRQEPAKDLEKLFGPAEESKDSDNIETPVVLMIRKKRSASNELGEEPKQRSLLDFDGPAVSNDPEEFEDWKSSNFAHKRVKRDHPLEFDEDQPGLDSNYIQDLEDSFAPSALEIQAKNSRDGTVGIFRELRSSSDSFGKKLRMKRGARDDKDEGNVARDSVVESDQDGARNEQQKDQKDASTESPVFSTENSILKEEFTSRKELNDAVNPKDGITSFVDPTAERTDRSEEEKQYREDNVVVSRQRKSAFGNDYLRDDNTITRNRLDDVYPDSIEDPQHPSPLVQLVRTKRFGDGFVYPESPELSYANEQPDISRAAEEPYAEDNGVIDSMLSKVDYRAANGKSRSARRENDNSYSKVEIDERPEMTIRDKRDSGSSRRTRRNSKTRGIKRKHKKKHKGKKKKNRGKGKKNKIKRTPLIQEREIYAGDSQSEMKRVSRDKNDVDRLNDVYDPDVISPHDGRRRRDYEDENDENFRFDANGSQPQRDPRESEDSRKIPVVGNYDKEDISRCAEERERITDDARTREKRESDVQELKYYENVSENNEGSNGTSQITDKDFINPKVAEPIRDIKELVQELLVKVNDLHGYVKDGTGDGGRKKDSRGFVTINNSGTIASTTQVPSKIVQRKSIGEKSKLKPVNAMRRRESYRKSPASKRSFELSRNGRPEKSAAVCDKKVRRKRKSHRKWDRWTDWSSCSVTCGRGRQIRWRHCVRSCSTAETEMEEKTCQLPACAPGRFLGLFC